jgi:hypothetical protein
LFAVSWQRSSIEDQDLGARLPLIQFGDDLAKNEALSSGMDDFIPKRVRYLAVKESLCRHLSLIEILSVVSLIALSFVLLVP